MKNIGMVIARLENLELFERTGLQRAEFVIFGRDGKDALRKYVGERGIRFSVHCPFFKPEDHPENPLLACIIDTDEERRQQALSLIRRTMEDGAEMGAEYAVAHIQRPVHFSGDDIAGVTEADAFEAARRSCGEIVRMSGEIGIPALLENLFDYPPFYSAESYLEVFREFPQLGFCLDVGHLDVDSRQFGFDFMGFVKKLSPHVRAVHLQNSHAAGRGYETRYWKVPVHPSQKPEEGWLDIPLIIREALRSNPDCKFNFECWPGYYPSLDMTVEGIEWAVGVYNEIRNELIP